MKLFWVWFFFVPWLIGMLGFIVRGWYFQLMLMNNLAPGESLWRQGSGFFDSSRYNEKGKLYHSKMVRLWCIAVVYGLGGLLLSALIGQLEAGFR